MSDETSAPAGGEAIAASVPATTPAPVENKTSELTVSEAARLLGQRRRQASAPEPAPVVADPVEPTELAQADSDPETDPAEVTSEVEPAEPPPIDPPRSWTQAEKERFQSLPRETQEYLHTREQEREREFRRGQNEVAEKLKAVSAKEQAAEAARQQFESKLSSTVKAMEATLQVEFGDIQTMADVRKLQAEDPFRFQAWQVRQMELTAARSDEVEAEGRKTHERQAKRNAYAVEQNKLLVDLVPEMGDPKKASELRDRAVKMLTDDLGLKNETLSRWMADDTGHEILENAGIQKLIADGLRYRDIQNAPKAVATKPVPPVQRPGAAKTVNTGNAQQIQALLKQVNSATGDQAIRLAAELRQLRRASR
jgi:hypothetical protein